MFELRAILANHWCQRVPLLTAFHTAQLLALGGRPSQPASVLSNESEGSAQPPPPSDQLTKVPKITVKCGAKVNNPIVKFQSRDEPSGYKWATDGLFQGYKRKRPLSVGGNSS
jgi:hypothetical protein